MTVCSTLLVVKLLRCASYAVSQSFCSVIRVKLKCSAVTPVDETLKPPQYGAQSFSESFLHCNIFVQCEYERNQLTVKTC